MKIIPSNKTKSFRDLVVWQKAHQLVLKVYQATRFFPKSEQYWLISQVRRSSISIAANISESYKKKTTPAKLNYLNIAEASLEETKYYFILSKDLEWIEEKEFYTLNFLSEEIGKLLNGYYNAIKKFTPTK